ncbi:uncharacterized protein LOC134181290 [Corticium candelabrum]|uniref:uncharacterized protein LOC134181290 n=1 Tax=Corticium candelabrum TaxID=121492 RepID=UPI002E25DF02|nr:uncharacterized protein LOC134181290 [Corticium candelabrum]
MSKSLGVTIVLFVLTLRAQSCGADRLDAVKGKNRPVEGTLILRCCLADDLTKRGIEHYWTLNGSMRCNSRDTHQLDDRIKCIKFELVPNYGYCNVLVVSSLRYEDAGLYDCHADGKSVNVTISVHSKVSPPTEQPITSKPTTIPSLANSTSLVSRDLYGSSIPATTASVSSASDRYTTIHTNGEQSREISTQNEITATPNSNISTPPGTVANTSSAGSSVYLLTSCFGVVVAVVLGWSILNLLN